MTNIRTNEKTRHSITSVLSDIMDLFGAMAKAEWEDVYGKPFEEPEAPAPAPKPEPRPESKPAKKEAKPATKPEKKPAKTETAPDPIPEPSGTDEPIKEYQTKLITHLDDVQIGDKVVNTSSGEEGTVLGVFNGEDLKVSTDHGIILVSVPSYGWSILEPEPETPGEGDEDFEETMDLCRQCDFSWVHTFPFSPRPGTPAFNMKPKIPQSVSQKRAHELNNWAVQQKTTYIKSFIGKPLPAIIEKQQSSSAEKTFIYNCMTQNFIHCQVSSPTPLQESKEYIITITDVLLENIHKGGEIEATALVEV